MRAKNIKVASLWANNKSAKSYNGQLSTDGHYLFSYDLVIGWTDASGKKVAILYNSPNGGFKSVTTSTHVRYASDRCDYTSLPIAQEMTKQKLKNLK
jgi:hypothetical protein